MSLSIKTFNSYYVKNKQRMCNFVTNKLIYNKPKLSTMKKNNLLLLVVTLMMTFSLASCLNDNFDEQAKRNQPTQAELKVASKTIQGIYQGSYSPTLIILRTILFRRKILWSPAGKSRMTLRLW